VLPAWPPKKSVVLPSSILENHTARSKQASGESLLLISPLPKTPIHRDDSRRFSVMTLIKNAKIVTQAESSRMAGRSRRSVCHAIARRSKLPRYWKPPEQSFPTSSSKFCFLRLWPVFAGMKSTMRHRIDASAGSCRTLSPTQVQRDIQSFIEFSSCGIRKLETGLTHTSLLRRSVYRKNGRSSSNNMRSIKSGFRPVGLFS
jgi:hypothetical protein